IGTEGRGWGQVTAELAFERSGPERYLSSMQLLVELVRRLAAAPDERGAVAIGRAVAHLATLRRLSASVAGMLDAGKDPVLEASLLKDLGGSFEQELPGVAAGLTGAALPRGRGPPLEEGRAGGTPGAPSFSLRGGARRPPPAI